jgi:hypothetical protein
MRVICDKLADAVFNEFLSQKNTHNGGRGGGRIVV